MSYDQQWGQPPAGPPQGYGQPAPQQWGPPPAPQGWGTPPAAVPQQPPVPQQPVTPPDPDELMQGGHKAARFEQLGEVIGGPLVEKPRTEQQRDFDSRQPKFYDDGNPMWQIVVAVQALPVTSDDDGVRAFYLKGQLKQAVQQAVRTAGAERLEVGGTLQVRYLRNEPNSRGRGNDKKIYEARYTPPTGGAPRQAPQTPAAAPPAPTAPDPAVMAHLPAGQQQNLSNQFSSEPPF